MSATCCGVRRERAGDDPQGHRRGKANGDAKWGAKVHASVVSRTFNDIEPQKLRWIWPGKIPLGKYSELIGYPGAGKVC